jgi:hypothetical protein
MYSTVEDLDKEFYSYNLYPIIYKSKNLIVKMIGSELIIMYKFYIMLSYNSDSETKRMFIYDMNKATNNSQYKPIIFEDNDMALVQYYILYQKGQVAAASELKIKDAFDKIEKLKVFI